MARRITTSALAMAGVFVALGWNVCATSPDGVEVLNLASSSREVGPNANSDPAHDHTTSLFARASGARQSPFGSFQASSDDQRPRQQLDQLLRDYHSGVLLPEEKMQIRQTLHDVKQDPLARSFIIETFLSAAEPQLAESMYGLIRDADLKDVGLLEGLIRRESAKSGTSTKTRIVDLIADLNTEKNAPYSAVIDNYLEQVTIHPDATLRNTAASQRIWYLAQHQPNNLAPLEQYILDAAPRIREEVYSVIESRIANPTHSNPAELALVQKAALHADHLGMSTEEKARVSALLDTLTRRGPGT